MRRKLSDDLEHLRYTDEVGHWQSLRRAPLTPPPGRTRAALTLFYRCFTGLFTGAC